MSEESRVVTIDAADMLWIDRRVDNHSVIVRADGEVDLVSAPQLDTQLGIAEAVVVPPAPVVLDLGGVSFIGLAGLNVLLQHRQRCTELGTRLEILGSHVVRRTASVAGLGQVLAVRALSQARPSSSGCVRS